VEYLRKLAFLRQAFLYYSASWRLRIAFFVAFHPAEITNFYDKMRKSQFFYFKIANERLKKHNNCLLTISVFNICMFFIDLEMP